ncbi:MAG: hypothetical protein AB7F43_07040 [Bacteriovoracia bacterium]
MNGKQMAVHELRSVLGGLREFRRSVYEHGEDIQEKRRLLELSIQKLEIFLAAILTEQQCPASESSEVLNGGKR